LEEYKNLIGHIPLKKNTFTDAGFRYRKNILTVSDNIIDIFGFTTKTLVFYDYEFFNLDIYSKINYNYSDPLYKDYKYKIGELFFRNSNTEVECRFKVQTLLDFIS